MQVPGRLLPIALLLLSVGAQGARAAEATTWYVYCEGENVGAHWAVFSENFWPHPDSADYGRRVGDAARIYFESQHDLSIEGCAAVNFPNRSLADHSRTRTVKLHKRMGDRVYFIPLPRDVLPDDRPADLVTVSAEDVDTASPEPAEPRQPERQWEPFTAPR
jgi:hypothetical protein